MWILWLGTTSLLTGRVQTHKKEPVRTASVTVRLLRDEVEIWSGDMIYDPATADTYVAEIPNQFPLVPAEDPIKHNDELKAAIQVVDGTRVFTATAEVLVQERRLK